MKRNILVILLMLSGLIGVKAQVTPAEKQALLDLYNATNGPNWATETDGFIGDEWDFNGFVTNAWYGVTVANGHVTELDLEFNELVGNLPASIGDLVHLTNLNLFSNDITGSIPNTIGNLIDLQSLNFGWNNLNGNIPDEIGNLTALTLLRLEGNDLNGAIPASLGNLVNLSSLNLSGNQLTGSIPLELLNNLGNLKYLTLYGNQLSGPLPSQLQNLTSLEILSLQSNAFDGSIPTEIANMTALEVIRLGGNNLSGTLPPELSNLINLNELSLQNNQLSGAIPPELGNLPNLSRLSLYNNLLSGPIPPELGNLPLNILDISNNLLTGAIPPELGNITNLYSLSLNTNQLSGSIPPELGNLSNNLSFVSLQNNQLSGAIPPELGNITNLFQLNLHFNNLSGPIPEQLGNLMVLERLHLNDNNLSGDIPPQVFSILPLTTFHVRNNRFDFGNLEYYFMNLFEYPLNHAPQQKTDQPQLIQLQEGENIVLSTNISGTQNHYQWYKDGQPINGAPDAPDYNINNVTVQDAGTYHCVMTSDIVNGLILTRHDIEIAVNGNPDEPETPEDPEKENWNMITVWDYDMNTNLKANARRYYDDLGKHVQTQSWDLTTNTLWGQATLYDYQGRAALSTMSAPIPGQDQFQYHPTFITNAGGTPYTTTDFEQNPYEPASVSADGPLGQYYTGLTSHPYQDLTAHPFVRTIFSDLIPNAPLAVVGGNKPDTNGDQQITPQDQWPQAYSFTMPASGELAEKNAFGEEKYHNIRTLKTVVRDLHGNENVTFFDTDGKLLATARSGGDGDISLPMELPIGPQGYVDIHLSKGAEGSIAVSNENAVTLYNLITDAVEPTTPKNLLPGFYRVAVNDLDSYQPNSITVTYQVNYYDYSLNLYDEAGRLAASLQPLADKDGNKLQTSYRYNTLGQLVETRSPDEGTARFKYRADGQIRYSQNTEQETGNRVSFTEYDPWARPIKSGVLTNVFFKDLDPDAPLPQQPMEDVVGTTYDQLTEQDYLFLANLAPEYHDPSFLAGNVAKTQNGMSTTYYSYDAYGRVVWLVQDIAGLEGAKTLNYEYWPLTGQVKKVIYQKAQADQFVHRYTYNQRDQLALVETSVDDNTFVPHAEYMYNDAGTLVRIEMAQGAQGLDYVYNLAGQLKSINHPSLDHANDPGGDTNDLFGMQLDYHLGDYQRPENTNIVTDFYGTDQLNGNIKGIRWQTAVNGGLPGHYTYSYDRNNWLTRANFDPKANTADYDVGPITYDANGNIQRLKRKKDPFFGVTDMDDLTYHYDPQKPNQLLWVEDAVGDVPEADDLEGHAPGNYQYNAIGQLVQDNSQQIAYIYNASGLVTEVEYLGHPLVKFFYNDRNHRVKKETYDDNGILQSSTYYVRDVAGQVMAVYSDEFGNMALVEQPMYGAGRVGIAYSDLNNQKTYVYQLTDHLGNVRAVFGTEGNEVGLKGFTDYYPFGMPMPNRTLLGPEGYRYAFQGQEKDPETGKEAFQLRLWDSRIGRWLTTDPYGQHSSPYLGMRNNPMATVDPDGGIGITPEQMQGIGNFLGEVDFLAQSLGGLDNFWHNLGQVQNLDGVAMAAGKMDYLRLLSFQFNRWVNSIGSGWFEKNVSGNPIWGTGGGTEELGNQRGENSYVGESYDMSEWVIPGSEGGKLKFWAHKANTVNHMLRAARDGAGAVNQANNVTSVIIEPVDNDTITYLLQAWKNGVHSGGIGGEYKGVRSSNGRISDYFESGNTYEWDSIQKIQLYGN
ncbi:leucine-rich repeat domain-containing protein [Flagellimonas sp.]|uniref:leucine-rich repeat domain-containing protein n=1 Tax=Flagellimonas sp. TaxID=2058762 RepID=UPI003BABEEB2